MPLTTQPFRNSNDLILKVLSNLGVAAVGQFISPEDFSKVQDNLDSIFRKIGALEICFVPDPDSIPGEWFIDLAAIVTGEVATDFGVSDAEFTKLTRAGLGGAGGVDIGAGVAAQSLKIMNRGKPTGEPTRIDYF